MDVRRGRGFCFLCLVGGRGGEYCIVVICNYLHHIYVTAYDNIRLVAFY